MPFWHKLSVSRSESLHGVAKCGRMRRKEIVAEGKGAHNSGWSVTRMNSVQASSRPPITPEEWHKSAKVGKSHRVKISMSGK